MEWQSHAITRNRFCHGSFPTSFLIVASGVVAADLVVLADVSIPTPIFEARTTIIISPFLAAPTKSFVDLGFDVIALVSIIAYVCHFG